MRTFKRKFKDYDISAQGIICYTLACAFLAYEMGLQVAPSIMTDSLMQRFNITAAGLGMLASAYFYSYTLMQIPAGIIFDRFNVKLVLPINILICVLGSVIFQYSNSVYLAALGRILMGFGSAFAFVAVLFVAGSWFAPRFFAILVGIAQLLANTGAASGEAPLAYFVNKYGLNPTINVVNIAGVVIAILCAIFLSNKSNTTNTTPTNKPETNIFAGIKEIMSNKNNFLSAGYAFLGWGPMSAFASFWGVPFLRDTYGLSITTASAALAFTWLGGALASPLIGWWSERWHSRRKPMLITAILGLIGISDVIWNTSQNYAMLTASLALVGIACGGQILTFAVTKEVTSAEHHGTAAGFVNMAVVLSGAIITPLIGLIMATHWDNKTVNGIAVYTTSDYQYGFITIQLCFFLCAAIAIFLKETYQDRTS